MFAVYLVLEVCMCTHRFFFFFVCLHNIKDIKISGGGRKRTKEKRKIIYDL